MASLVPTNFPNAPSSAIPTYNSFDLTKGTGSVIFNLLDSSGSYTLTTDSLYGHKGYFETTGSFVEFPVKFERPITLLGTFTTNINMAMIKTTAGGTTGTMTSQINLVISGSTTTTLVLSGSISYSESISGSSAEIVDKSLVYTGTIDTPKRIRRGEYLVLKLNQSVSGATNLYTGTDPKGRSSVGGDFTLTWEEVTGASQISVPVRTEFTG